MPAVLPTVLIIPGLNGHPGMLMRSAPELFPGWRAVAFSHHMDLAEGGVEGLAWRAFRALDRESRDESRDEPVVVCGESFGGTVALTMAHLRPERVRGLVLLSAFGRHPTAVARHGVGALAVWTFIGSRVSNSAYRAGRLASMPTQLGLRFTSDLMNSYISRPRADMAAYKTKVELSLMFDARPWLASLQCPTFVLTGTWDPIVPTSAGRELARCIPNAVLHRLPGGHLAHLVHARRVGSLLSEWARNLQ